MGTKDCVIKLDNPYNTYCPGQTIKGVAEFTFDSPKKLRAIIVKIKGLCHTGWSKSKTASRGRRRQVYYEGNEEYFSFKNYLLGSNSDNLIEIEAGTHSYPFACVLPPILPSSFEGEYGHVRYTIKVTLDRPWKFDENTKIAFTIVSHLDLNLNPNNKLPIQIYRTKSFCCWWCISGPLVVDVNIPATGFCSGQSIPVDVSVENGSNVAINDVVIKLVKHILYRVNDPWYDTRSNEITVSKIKLGGVAKNSSMNWQEFLKIPPLPPSNLVNCSLIDVDYKFKVICKTSGIRTNITEKKTIVLGTIPLAGFYPDAPSGNDNQPAPAFDTPVLPESCECDPDKLQLQENFMYLPVSVYPNMPQPTFLECQFSAKSSHDSDNGNINFAPRYPTYEYRVTAPTSASQFNIFYI